MINGTDQPVVLFSIGHSNHSIETFLALLHQHKLQVLIDVRSSPYSRYVPQFNSTPLSSAVQQAGIKYGFMGDTLGGRPDGDEFYDADSYVLYERMASASFFLKGIKRIQKIGNYYRAAILCSEENPAICHRHLLIGRVLRQQGCELLHIRGNGRLQTEEELASREGTPIYGHSLWGEQLAQQGESAWKSIRPVLRKKQQVNSSER
jgi:uncharacterized protein (DUF488 family)